MSNEKREETRVKRHVKSERGQVFCTCSTQTSVLQTSHGARRTCLEVAQLDLLRQVVERQVVLPSEEVGRAGEEREERAREKAEEEEGREREQRKRERARDLSEPVLFEKERKADEGKNGQPRNGGKNTCCLFSSREGGRKFHLVERRLVISCAGSRIEDALRKRGRRSPQHRLDPVVAAQDTDGEMLNTDGETDSEMLCASYKHSLCVGVYAAGSSLELDAVSEIRVVFPQVHEVDLDSTRHAQSVSVLFATVMSKGILVCVGVIMACDNRD